MQITLNTNQEIRINNYQARIVSIDPEHPSKITVIKIEYLEGPLAGIQKNLEIFNQE